MRARRFPKYPSRAHRSGQARIRIDGHDYYLGLYSSPESYAEYERLLNRWRAGGCHLMPEAKEPLTCAEAISAFLHHAKIEYPENGSTSQFTKYARGLAYVHRLYGSTLAADFGPLSLEACRQAMTAANLSRNYVNRLIVAIRTAWRWLASRELIAAERWQALRALPGLRVGKGGRETEAVRPVPEVDVLAVLPVVSRQVAAVLKLQLLTGARPGELLAMKSGLLTMVDDIWEYRPPHKNLWRGQERVIYLGRQAQEVIRPFLRPALEEYLFQPCEAAKEFLESRKRKVRKRSRRMPGQRYTTASYRRAVARGCKRAGVPDFHPHQIRHTVGTRVRAEFGPDAARAVLGQKSLKATEIYAELDAAKAQEAARKIG